MGRRQYTQFRKGQPEARPDFRCYNDVPSSQQTSQTAFAPHLSPEVEQLQNKKNGTWSWIFLNVVMIFVAGGISISSYQGAASNDGGTYYVWWGPIAWGVINLFRFIPRLVKLNKSLRQLQA